MTRPLTQPTKFVIKLPGEPSLPLLSYKLLAKEPPKLTI